MLASTCRNRLEPLGPVLKVADETMKLPQFLLAFASASVIAVGLAFADPAKPAPAGTKGGCCVKAEKDGKTCSHPCCVEAAKAGKNCEKCGGTNEKKP